MRRPAMIYRLSHKVQRRLREVPRGSRAGTIPDNCELYDVIINGHTRNLSDWLAIAGMDLYTFARRCKPGYPVALTLGFKPDTPRQYLDNSPASPITRPTKLSQLKRRITKFRRYLTRQQPLNVEVTHIASQMMFVHAFKAWKTQRPFNSSAQDYYPWANVLKDPVSNRNYAEAVDVLERYGFLVQTSSGYMPTAYAIDQLYTKKVWLLGAMQRYKWLQAYTELVAPLGIYSIKPLMADVTPGYELFRYYCKLHKIKVSRKMLGKDILNILSYLDEQSQDDYTGEPLPTTYDLKAGGSLGFRLTNH